jgi:hypothetical protein
MMFASIRDCGTCGREQASGFETTAPARPIRIERLRLCLLPREVWRDLLKRLDALRIGQHRGRAEDVDVARAAMPGGRLRR